MDRATATKIVDHCAAAFEPLNEILLDRSPGLTDEEFGRLRGAVGDVLAYIVDLLIEPAVRRFPDVKPFGMRKDGDC